MVLVAGSTESRNSGSGTAGAGRRQPVVLVALQPPMLVTDRMFLPPTFTTYVVPVWGMSANAFGPGLYRGPWSGAVARWAGGGWRQPDVAVPLQVWVLIADSVLSPWLTANTVCSPRSTATNCGFAPVVAVGGVVWQPDVTVPLQVAPLMTETVPSLLSAT